MPKLRDLWPEWSSDTRWWINPMEDRLRPGPLPGVAESLIACGSPPSR
jgi:hypothetical protein